MDCVSSSPQEQWLPLLSSARGIFFAQELDPENPCYNTAEVLECPEEMDIQLLRQGLQQVYQENESFRVQLRAFDGKPQQRLISLEDFVDINPLFPIVELSQEHDQNLSEEYIQGHSSLPSPVARWALELMRRPLDLGSGQTVRSQGILWQGRLWLVHIFHHSVADGFAVFNALGRVLSIYRALKQGQPIPEVKRGSLRSLLEADAQSHAIEQEQQNFWESNPMWNSQELQVDSAEPLLGVLSQPDTTIAGYREPASSYPWRACTELDQNTEKLLLELSQKYKVAWPTVVIAGIGAYLTRASYNQHVSVGIPQMNRMLPAQQQPFATACAQIGCTAVNVLPVLVSARLSGEEQIHQVHQQQQRNQRYALVRQEELERLAHRHQGRLFGAQINVVPFDSSYRVPEGRVIVHNLNAGPVDDMTFCLRGVPGRGQGISCEIDANSALYTFDETQRHLTRLVSWLNGWAQDLLTEDGAETLSICTAEELQELEKFNSTAHPVTYRSLLERFQHQVKKTPDAIAVRASAAIHCDAPNALICDRELTYAELDAQARVFAGALKHHGVSAHDAVGLRFHRGIEQYIAVYGLLYAGAVYVPLLPELPAERVSSMVQDANIRLIIHGPETPPQDGSSAPTTPEIHWDQLELKSEHNIASEKYLGEQISLDDAAYILFTSGSTGRPKGAAISHRAIDNRLRWQQHQIPISDGDVVLHKTPISFDVHVWELYWPLQEGATVLIAAPEGHKDPAYLARVICEQNVTCVHFVPAMLTLFLSSPTASRILQERPPKNLRYVVCSGEALLTEHVTRTHQLLGVYPLNLYGPTEAAVDVTYFDTAEEPQRHPIPIGKPVWNTHCYIVDPTGAVVPAGVTGELVLAGVQLSQGYCGNPDANERSFFTMAVTGERCYRTGDIAQWNDDGTITYRGRNDAQVKIAGQRLELGEVESVLNASPLIRSAIARIEYRGSEPVLAAIYEMAEPYSEHLVEDSISQVRQYCAEHLAPYMVPTLWAVLPELPVGTSGKIDRKSLTNIDYGASQTTVDTPETLQEEQLCALYAEVLGVEHYGAQENFLLSGGNSLKALELVALLERRLGTRCTLGTIFAAPTPRELSAAMGHDERREFSHVLILREGSREQIPWVFLAPAGGLGWSYSSYMAHLPEDASVILLQTPHYEDPEYPEPQSIEELALYYVGLLESLQLATFYLVGWSVGGTVSVDVASLASARGMKVKQCVILDGYPAQQWASVAEPSEEDTYRALLRMGGIDTEESPLSLGRAVELLKGSGSALGHLGERDLQTCIRTMGYHTRLMRSSTQRVFNGDTVVIAVAHDDQPFLDASAWAKQAPHVRVHHIKGVHPSLVQPSRVQEILTLCKSDVS
ncbi:amino acid adenylation domain-containing protein [Rothia sp. P13129]|uniref:amino acid adenylation domain-containing protein n=1 Tax=Rothia sp. P13129 TaxID=3402664 RepID=UPI003AC7578C